MENPQIEQVVRVSIKLCFEQAISAFQALWVALVSCNGTETPTAIPPESLDDELAFFRLWATTNGAHHHGRASLDHKLRLSGDIHEKVVADLRALKKGKFLIRWLMKTKVPE